MNRALRFIRSLPASDQAIAGALGILFILGCFLSLTTLIRHFQVLVPAYGGSFTEGVVGSPRFVNPLLAATDSDRDLVALTYAGLMGHAANGELMPVLAEKYEVSTDGTLYTFTLREGLQFSDGSSVSADDVVYTVQKAQDPGLKSTAYANWARIRVEALDARTVRFTLPQAYAPFLEDATLGILPKHVWQDVPNEEFAFSPFVTMPVGAGPFEVTKVTRDAEGAITAYKLSRFDHYALGAPFLSSIKFLFYESDEDLAEAFAGGKVDSAYGLATGEPLVAPYTRIIGVYFNTENNPALEDLGVRKALSLAVNRRALTEQLLGGYATPTFGPVPVGIVPDATSLATSTEESSTQNAAANLPAAREALEEAGYIFDETARAWSNDELTLSITLTTSNVPELKAVASEVKKDWEALGVPVSVELADPMALAQSVIRPRAYSALLFGEVIGTSPDLYAFWSSKELEDPGLNIAGYANEEVDALLERARTERDPAVRTALIEEASNAIAADYPAVFLYTPDFLYNAPASVQGIALSHLSSPADRFWGAATWYRYAEHVWPVFVPEAS